MSWWTREPGRVLAEEDALRALVARGGVLGAYHWQLTPEAGVRIQATLALGPREQAVEVRFPAHYPRQCPAVLPVPYGTRLSEHQFRGDGVLCLEIGPDNWLPRYTAADMLGSAWRLLVHEAIAAVEPWEIPSRHVTHLGELVRQHPLVLVRPASLAERLASLSEGGEFTAHIIVSESGFQVWPLEVPSGSPLPGVPSALRTDKPTTGRLLRLGPNAPREPPRDRASFIEFVATHAGHQCGDKFELLLLVWPDGSARGYPLAGQTVTALVDVPFEDGGPRLPTRTAAVTSSLRVGIVGLGSLGSKVAASLARSGVRRFVLADGDVVLGPNVTRHAARYEQVGMMKVHAAAALLREVALEEIDCIPLTSMLVSATNPEVHELHLEVLGKVDVLVDATADPDVFNTLADLASRERIPLVWAEVFEGGLGGLVGAAHPRRTPCPQCVRAGFLAHAHAWPPAPRSSSLRPYESGRDIPLVATDADVNFIAAALTARVLEAGDAAADPAAPVVLFGLRRGWIFERAFDTMRVEVLADDWSCPWCWREPEAPDPEALRRATAILTGKEPDADDPDRA